jgi:lipid II:glycine glycyltransferase (peptidoglycan interpeptide bridge formation enzyme)
MEITAQIDPAAWDRFVEAHPHGHILQTVGWGQLKGDFGWAPRRVAVRATGQIVAGAQVLFRQLPGGSRLAYVPKGPVVDLARTDRVQSLLDALHSVCRAERAFALKIEPDLPGTPGLAQQLAGYAFRASEHTIQPQRTILVDLAGDEDQILMRMKSKTRYNIRLAGRKGVEVRAGGLEDVATFSRLIGVTGERQEFGVHSAAYYRRAYESLVPAGQARLLIARYEGQPLAAVFACAAGQKSWYMYGASSNQHRELMAPYAVQWAAMQWARERGCTSYDLWGIPDEDQESLEAQFTERSDGLWGVYRHKRGYGGQIVRYAGAFDYVYNKPLYTLYRLATRLRAGLF